MHTATLTSKGQLSLPASVRRGLGVRSGDRLTFVEDAAGGYRVVALRKTRQSDALAGFLKRHAPAQPVSLWEMEAAIAEAAVASGLVGLPAGKRKAAAQSL